MNDWIEWDGGECPVKGTAFVDIKVRMGDTIEEVRADELDWGRNSRYDPDGEFDVVAYRIAT